MIGQPLKRLSVAESRELLWLLDQGGASTERLRELVTKALRPRVDAP